MLKVDGDLDRVSVYYWVKSTFDLPDLRKIHAFSVRSTSASRLQVLTKVVFQNM